MTDISAIGPKSEAAMEKPGEEALPMQALSMYPAGKSAVSAAKRQTCSLRCT